MKKRKIVKEPLVWILLVLIFSISTYKVLPIEFLRTTLTISMSLKSLLLMFIPFLIFSGTASAFSSLKNNGFLFVVGIMGIIITSNFVNLIFSGIVGCYLIPLFIKTGNSIPIINTDCVIVPYFYLHLPNIFSNGMALVSGIFLGIINSLFGFKKSIHFVDKLHKFVMKCMMKGFIPVLPLFLFGFILKLLAEGQMTVFVQSNGEACLVMVLLLIFYLLIWFLFACYCSKTSASILLKNIFPAVITGATTMSSAAALPFSLEAAVKNTKDETLANAVMPITLNFHMVGDTICIPVMAIIILNSFSCQLPTFGAFLGFGLCFVLNKFAGAGIPGGTIMVSLPILSHYLGFNDDMLAFITAFYMLIDPITTSGNVTANNFLVIFIKKFWGKITKNRNLK